MNQQKVADDTIPYPRKWVAGTLPSDNDANDQKTGLGRESKLATLLPALMQA